MSGKSDDGATQPGAKAPGRMKLVLAALLPLLLLGGGAAAYMLGMVPGAGPGGEAAGRDGAAEPATLAAASAAASSIVFVDLPDLLLNLNVTGHRLRFLKVAAALEVRDERQAEIVRRFIPRILDNFHLYLRSVQPEELAGPDGVYRVKEDLLARINDMVRPAQVRDVLVKEMLIQ